MTHSIEEKNNVCHVHIVCPLTLGNVPVLILLYGPAGSWVAWVLACFLCALVWISQYKRLASHTDSWWCHGNYSFWVHLKIIICNETQALSLFLGWGWADWLRVEVEGGVLLDYVYWTWIYVTKSSPYVLPGRRQEFLLPHLWYLKKKRKQRLLLMPYFFYGPYRPKFLNALTVIISQNKGLLDFILQPHSFCSKAPVLTTHAAPIEYNGAPLRAVG